MVQNYKQMKNNQVVAKRSWNRLEKTVRYTSNENDSIQIDAIFKKDDKKNKFVIHLLKVMSNGYSPNDLQNKLNQIQDSINRDYLNKIQ